MTKESTKPLEKFLELFQKFKSEIDLDP